MFALRGVPPSALAWPSRADRVLSVLERGVAASLHRPPSILCLQEVDEFDQCYKARLRALGYACAFAARSGANVADDSDQASADDAAGAGSSAAWARRSVSKRSKADGVVIAWQTSQFQLDDATNGPAVHRVDFDDLAFAAEELATYQLQQARAASSASSNLGPSAFDSALVADPRLLRHNVGMFVYLRPVDRSSSSPLPSPLLVSNLHLYWNPLHEDVKQKQMQYLMHLIQDECSRRMGLTNLTTTASDNDSSATAASAVPSALAYFPFLCCGDFNSTPLSGIYRSITQGAYDAADSSVTASSAIGSSSSLDVAASASSSSVASPVSLIPAVVGAPAPLRFICDVDLVRVAKWLRSIGIDCAHFNDAERTATGGFPALFARAINEKRILLTRSAKLVERRGCPPFFLLHSQADLEPSFAHVVQHFGLCFRSDLFYSRCIFCNSVFQTIPREYFLGGTDDKGVHHEPHEPPPDMPAGFVRRGYCDDDGQQLTFQRCVDSNPFQRCGKLYWWGRRSDAAVQKFKEKLDEIINKQHHEGDGEETEDEPGADAVAAPAAASCSCEEKSDDGDATSHPSVPAPVPLSLSPARLHQLRLAARIARSDTENAAAFSTALPLAGVRLCSAYADLSSDGRSEPAFTNLTSSFADCLDYIFFSRPAPHTCPTRIVLHSAQAVTDGAGIDMEAIQRTIGGANSSCCNSSSSPSSVSIAAPSLPLTTCIPNSVWPSDHLMLTARLSIEPSAAPTPVTSKREAEVRARQKLILLDLARLEERMTALAAHIAQHRYRG